jgi:hypothetical protein
VHFFQKTPHNLQMLGMHIYHEYVMSHPWDFSGPGGKIQVFSWISRLCAARHHD